MLVLLGELYVRKNKAEGAVETLRGQLNERSEVVVVEDAPMFAIYTRAEECAELAARFFERVKAPSQAQPY